MSSQNAGEQEGKPDFGLIFDDFPHCWGVYPHIQALIDNDYEKLLDIASSHCTVEDVLKAREYGVKKYARMNWRESKGTADHNNFLAANKRSIYRHIVVLKNQDIDPESGCRHWAMVELRCMIAIEYGCLDVVMETAVGSGEFETWDKIIADKIDSLYQWPEDPQYIYAAFASYGEIFYTTMPPIIDGEKLSYVGGFIDTANKMAPIELRPHWKVSVRKRPT